MSADKKARSATLGYAEMGSFFENMAMMIKAGITVNEAVGLLREETEQDNKLMLSALTGMNDEMSVGTSFEDAMRNAGAFPDYAVDMVGAAEYTGRLEDTLFHLSEYYRSEESMRRTLISAVRYPIILLVMVIAVLIVMLKLVFPAFVGVYNNLTGSLSASSYRYIDVSFVICRVMLVVMIVLVAILLIGVLMWRGGKRDTIQKILMKFPAFSQLISNLDLYRFTSCFDMFISSGELQDEALKKSMPVVETQALQEKLER
ncbi:MAG: type II secretion system F family protein, partial [Eubacterium sp.]|nr:type II secretion system F family protein [Eubacterium sp.]